MTETCTTTGTRAAPARPATGPPAPGAPLPGAVLVDGPAVQADLLRSCRALRAEAEVEPRVVLVAVDHDDPLLLANVALHRKVLGAAGIDVDVRVLPPGTQREELSAHLSGLEPGSTDAALVLLPLPEHLDVRLALSVLDPVLEVEGLHPAHAARLLPVDLGGSAPRPVAVQAVLEALASVGRTLEGARVVVLTDRHLMETNPVANLVARVAAPAMTPLSASVALVPRDHPHAREQCLAADVLVVSVEEAGVVDAGWVSAGTAVIDFNPVVIGFRTGPSGTPAPLLAGGVDPVSVGQVAAVLAAVPGGVGPVMLGLLARRVVEAAVSRRRSSRAARPAGDR